MNFNEVFKNLPKEKDTLNQKDQDGKERDYIDFLKSSSIVSLGFLSYLNEIIF